MAAREPSSTAPVASDALARRARRAYERARFRQSLIDCLPAFALGGLMLLVAARPRNLALAAMVVGAAIICRYAGQGWARGVGPAVGLALVPLLMPSLAGLVSPGCEGGTCPAHSFCNQACGLAGLLSGVALAWIHGRASLGPEAWAVSGTILAAASLAGCTCVGFASLGWFVAALVASAVAGRVALQLTTARSA